MDNAFQIAAESVFDFLCRHGVRPRLLLIVTSVFTGCVIHEDPCSPWCCSDEDCASVSLECVNRQCVERPLAGWPVKACGMDQYRQFICGEPTQEVGRTPGMVFGACPERPGTMFDKYGIHVWKIAPDNLRPDPDLTRFARRSAPENCCYSNCQPAPVRAHPDVKHSFSRLQCLPAMETSVPAAGHEHCPAAVKFPGDFIGHVAPLDPAGTREIVRQWQSDPIMSAISWCCYQSAPGGAIYPK